MKEKEEEYKAMTIGRKGLIITHWTLLRILTAQACGNIESKYILYIKFIYIYILIHIPMYIIITDYIYNQSLLFVPVH